MIANQRTAVQAEWIKLRSVRSNLVCFVAVVVISVGLGAIFSSSGRAGRRALVSPVAISLAGFRLAQLVIGVLGVLLVSSEYSSGLIRTTLAAVRSRSSVLTAKVAVFAAATTAVCTVAAFAAFLIGQAVYKGPAGGASLGDPGVLRAVIGTVGYCVGVGLLGVALGFLLRSTAGAIGVLFSGLLLVPGLAGLLPWSWATSFTKILPSNAGDAFTSVTRQADLLSPGVGLVVFVVWVLGLLAVASAVLERRDA